ncbi:cupin domain-containing protein [Nostocoides australiense]|uniref:cupin domain-containing protein n=1 Tax=Nostocoides australiense TaxID=99480 RepID=UPI0006604B55
MGVGSTLWLKVTGEESLGLVIVLSGVVHSGGTPLRIHESEGEVVIVIEVELDYQVGDDRGALTSGGILWFPRRVPHAVANLSQEPRRFITVVTPAVSRTSSAVSVTTSPQVRLAIFPTHNVSRPSPAPTCVASSARRSPHETNAQIGSTSAPCRRRWTHVEVPPTLHKSRPMLPRR